MKNPFLYLAIGVIKVYKFTLSPAFAALGIRCRHEPGCANYGIEALRKHGVWRGFWLTLSRVLRCHPWGSSGLDPVPEKLHKQALFAPWRYGDWAWTERCGGQECPHNHEIAKKQDEQEQDEHADDNIS